MINSKEAGVGIEELARVFIEVAREKGYTGSLNVNAGLRAVLAKLEPEIAEAFVQGVLNAPAEGYDANTANGIESNAKRYATRWRKSISGDTDV